MSVLIVVLTAMGSFIGALSLFAPPATAQTCDQAGPAISGNWVINTAQVCTGIVYTVDGSITIAAGGSLTLTNGGLKFTEDTTHIYSLTVTAGRPFILDNSIITTEPRSLNAYVKLGMHVAGSFTMRNNAIVKFPGVLDSSAGATITIDHSTITGFTNAEVTQWVGASAADDNDDAPTLTFVSTTVDVYNSRIERLFEDAGGSSPSPRAIITLSGNTVLTAINSYIGVDFSPDINRLHNEIDASGTSQATLVGVTIDQAQSDAAAPDTWIPPFVPVGGSSSNFNFYRWLDVFVTDNTGIPASGAGVWSQFGGFRQTVFYPDNGNALCPGAKILTYIGRNCANFNVTGADGHALIPVFTDRINTTTAPNAASFGTFEETALVAPYTVSANVAFDPYPVITAVSNAKRLTLPIAGLSVPGTVQWSTTMSITGTVISVAGSIEITGSVTITNGGVYLTIPSDACNRAVVKITGIGRLTLINSTVGSNCPMTLYAGNTGRLTASRGSSLNLDGTAGAGKLRSEGSAVLTVSDSVIDGDVLAMGFNVTFKRDAFRGGNMTINTAGKSDLWDADMGSMTTLKLLSDDGSVGTPDFDIRNTTFDATLTPQLTFGGRQWAQLTAVSTANADWWTGMISGSAKVSRYSWLTVNGVDGTGTLLEGANARIQVSRLNPTTLVYAPAPAPGVGDIYMAAPGGWPVNAPFGFIIYRASAEERYAAPGAQWANSTYRGEADATVGLPPIRYYPDANVSAFVQADTTIQLVFSDLTPEMSIGTILVRLEANTTSTFQPIGRPLNLTAVVRNTGKISVRNTVVSFFNTNVDINNDGVMDTTKGVYISSGLWIGDYTVPLLPLNSTALAWVTWTPQGVAETTVQVSIVVDAPLNNPLDPGTFRELNERNNIGSASILLFVWPDLSVGTADINPATAIHGNPTTVDVTVHNEGTNDASLASLVLSDDTGWSSFPPTYFNLGRGQSTTIHMSWTPTSPGSHTLFVSVLTPILPVPPDRNHDYNWANNGDDKPVSVNTKPDIWLNQAVDFATTLSATRGVPFDMKVIVRNNGDTAAVGFSVSVFLDGDTSAILGHTDNVNVAGQGLTNSSVVVLVPTAVGLHRLTVFADSYNTDGTPTRGSGSIVEISEANNWANQSVNLVPPSGSIVMNAITSPVNGFAPGETILVEGYVRDPTTDPLAGIPVLVEFLDLNGNPVTNATYPRSDGDGGWRVGLLIPSNAVDGVHRIRASSPSGSSIAGQEQTITVRNPTTFWNIIFLGLPVWLWLIIVVAAVVAIVAVTMYFRVYGLGKMVECGECGSFIPEDSTTCPKCGVEFEKDMAKCSNCQAWIPVDVKQCPECGVEFATGKVEMADYQEKMRMQYDEVVAKFREESQRVLGRSLTEREFQDWWRKQPTFVTFEDWLREEEEMRKMGSKPCPACGTLNSVTATVCHKCGTYLKESKGPSGGAPPMTQPSGGESAGTAPSEAVPKKVIRKPVAAPPIVQKKVIKKPLGEGEQGGESDTQNPADEEF